MHLSKGTHKHMNTYARVSKGRDKHVNKYKHLRKGTHTYMNKNEHFRKRVSDCCLMLTQQFFNYIMSRKR